MDRVQQRRDPDHREAGDLGSRRPLAGAETTSGGQEKHPESKNFYINAYTLFTAKKPLKVTHPGAGEKGELSPKGTEEANEGGRVGPPPGAELSGGGQGRPRLRDAQGRRPRGPGSEEGADPGAEARQGAGRVTRPLTFPFLFFVPRFST